MSNLKTIKQWYQDDLPDPYRTKAIKYAGHYGRLDIKVKSSADALKMGFVWAYTKENEDRAGYWRDLFIKLKMGEKVC